MSDGQAAEVMSRPLPNGWNWIPLGQYVENHDGRRVPISRSERESRQGAYPYYGASGVIDTIDGFTHDGEFVLIGEDGANLLTRSKPLAFLTRGKVWINNHAHVLRCKPGFPNAYLAYYINSINLSAYVTGTAQPKLSQSMMNKIPIPVASPEQQIEIVAELEKQFSRLDEAVANLQRVKANLKRYKASVLKAAVEGRLVETEATLSRREGRTFETGEQLLQRVLEERRASWSGRGKYKEPSPPDTTSFKTPPEGWVWASADQLTSVITDGEHITPRRTEEGVLLLSARNVLNGSLALNDVDFVPEEEYERIAKRIAIQAGDVLLSCSGTVGRSCVVPQGLRFTLVRSVAVLRPVIMLSDFMTYNLQSPLGQSQIDDRKTQTAQANLFQGKIRQLVFALPSLAEQVRIVAEVDRHLSIIREVEAEVDANLQRAQALRQATLSKAFAAI